MCHGSSTETERRWVARGERWAAVGGEGREEDGGRWRWVARGEAMGGGDGDGLTVCSRTAHAWETRDRVQAAISAALAQTATPLTSAERPLRYRHRLSHRRTSRGVVRSQRRGAARQPASDRGGSASAAAPPAAVGSHRCGNHAGRTGRGRFLACLLVPVGRAGRAGQGRGGEVRAYLVRVGRRSLQRCTAGDRGRPSVQSDVTHSAGPPACCRPSCGV